MLFIKFNSIHLQMYFWGTFSRKEVGITGVGRSASITFCERFGQIRLSQSWVSLGQVRLGIQVLADFVPSSQIREYLAGYKNNLSKATIYLFFIYLHTYFCRLSHPANFTIFLQENANLKYQPKEKTVSPVIRTTAKEEEEQH